jgi:hypothetical protein
MALKKPLVIYGGQTAQLQSGDTLDAPTDGTTQLVLTNNEIAAVVIGAPVYVSGNDVFLKARANAAATTRAVGLVAVSPSIAAAGSGAVALSGPLLATTAQWDAVTGQVGGLTAGTQYFLDPSTSGKLTTTAPSAGGQYVASIGTAIDTTTMMITIDPQTTLL